jgi:ParB/RepB/Spo0J family partition protein
MKLANLVQSRFNKRREYLPEMITDLAESIKEHGLISRLALRPLKDGTCEVLAGWRRKLALKQVHGEDYDLPETEYVILAVSDFEAVKISIVENVQRVNLSALDLAEAAKALIEEQPNLKHKAIAKILWTTEARVTRLLGLDEHLDDLPQQAVDSLAIPDENDPAFTDSHVAAMAKHGAFDLGEDKVKDLCDLIIEQELPASKVQSLVEKMTAKESQAPISDSSSDNGPEKPKDDPTMTDYYKGVLVYDGGQLTLEGKKGNQSVDLSYYHPFVNNPDKYKVHVDAKVRIENL